ncbi:MAG: tRNA (adenosine(37)-N6)-threonylcarbamoyltransferase complex dimerization subunit type 1 TsaB [Pseudomonadales bacterium]
MLAIETSSSRCCVALLSGGVTRVDDRQADRSHKELLLHMVSELCASAKIRPAQLDALGCGAGPGSFTGVRIGTAATQALALAAGAPVVMVNSLDVLALVAQRDTDPERQQSGQTSGFICARRSRASAYYVARYPGSGVAETLAARRGPMSLVQSLSEFQVWLAQQQPTDSPIPVVGELPDWLADSHAADQQTAATLVPVAVDAHAVLALTLAGLAADAAVAPAAALPVYLPEDSPWRPQ